MLAYLIKRILFLFLTLFIIVGIQTYIIQSLPGSPALLDWYATHHGGNQLGKMLENTQSSQAHALRATQEPGMPAAQKPINSVIEAIQGALYLLKNLLCMNWGESTLLHQPVRDIVMECLGFSLGFTFLGLGVSYMLGALLGRRQKNERKNHFVFAIIEGMPTTIISIVLILLFASGMVFDFFPLGGLPEKEGGLFLYALQCIYYLFLPFVALVLSSLVPVLYIWQSAFDEVYRMPFVTTLRTLRFSEEHIFWRYILKNAAYPVLAKFPHHMIKTMFKGALVIEILFNLDGIGRLGYEALLARDYPLMYALLYLYALLNIIFTLLSDICLFMLDRRVQVWEKKYA